MKYDSRYAVFVYLPSGINIVTRYQKKCYKLTLIYPSINVKFGRSYTDYGQIRIVKPGY